MEIVRQIKEALSYVAADFDQELDKYNKNPDENVSVYELPDGTKIPVFSEKFKAPELLFQPDLKKIEGLGVHETLYKSITKCDIDLRKSLYQNNH